MARVAHVVDEAGGGVEAVEGCGDALVLQGEAAEVAKGDAFEAAVAGMSVQGEGFAEGGVGVVTAPAGLQHEGHVGEGDADGDVGTVSSGDRARIDERGSELGEGDVGIAGLKGERGLL